MTITEQSQNILNYLPVNTSPNDKICSQKIVPVFYFMAMDLKDLPCVLL